MDHRFRGGSSDNRCSSQEAQAVTKGILELALFPTEQAPDVYSRPRDKKSSSKQARRGRGGRKKARRNGSYASTSASTSRTKISYPSPGLSKSRSDGFNTHLKRTGLRPLPNRQVNQVEKFDGLEHADRFTYSSSQSSSPRSSELQYETSLPLKVVRKNTKIGDHLGNLAPAALHASSAFLSQPEEVTSHSPDAYHAVLAWLASGPSEPQSPPSFISSSADQSSDRLPSSEYHRRGPSWPDPRRIPVLSRPRSEELFIHESFPLSPYRQRRISESIPPITTGMSCHLLTNSHDLVSHVTSLDSPSFSYSLAASPVSFSNLSLGSPPSPLAHTHISSFPFPIFSSQGGSSIQSDSTTDVAPELSLRTGAAPAVSQLRSTLTETDKATHRPH